jgi:predicted aldo/keto reductase-like oxidoreductase
LAQGDGEEIEKIMEAETMETHRLGKTGMQVAHIGFGGMTIPRVGVERAVATLNRALDLGVNFFDTARIYGKGDSERKIGRVMKYRRSEVYLSSRSPDMSYEGMKRAVEESLLALQTDYIDLYEPHDVSSEAKYEQLTANRGGLKALREAKEQGKIRHIGLTSHNWDIISRMIRETDIEAVLITYNLADRQAEEKVIPLAEEYDVGLFVMKVFGNARLLELSPPGKDRKPTVEECLRFALSNDRLPLILTGVKSPEEIEQNVSIAETTEQLSVEERRELADFGDRLGRGYCLGCEYCLPCPQNIPIPVITQLLDRQERMNWDWPQARMEYANFNATIEDCIDCGKCEERCPQNLPVRERLREAHERFAVSG